MTSRVQDRAATAHTKVSVVGESKSSSVAGAACLNCDRFVSRTLKEQLDLCLRAVGVDAAEHETEERQGRESEDNKNREDYACLTEAPHDPESYGRVEDGA